MIELFLPLFLLMFAAIVIEGLMLRAWKPLAFRSGFVIFRRSLGRIKTSEIDAEEVEARFSGRLAPAIAFRKNGESELFFRETFFSWSFLSYTPIMHGLVVSLPDGRTSLTGRLSWSSIMFLTFWYAFLFSFPWQTIESADDPPPEWLFSVFLYGPIGLYALVYFTQRYRYGNIASYIRERHNK